MLLNKSQEDDLATHLESERQMLRLSFKTEDYREGNVAFLEKRAPIVGEVNLVEGAGFEPA